MSMPQHSKNKPTENTVILHLTDLHFGCDLRDYDLVKRELVLNALIEEIRALDRDWRPNVVAVSGDIGWKGIAADYAVAREWFIVDPIFRTVV
jgi:3',5'-cyclic AMP phosphodiesterase CpdA